MKDWIKQQAVDRVLELRQNRDNLQRRMDDDAWLTLTERETREIEIQKIEREVEETFAVYGLTEADLR